MRFVLCICVVFVYRLVSLLLCVVIVMVVLFMFSVILFWVCCSICCNVEVFVWGGIMGFGRVVDF